MINIDARTAPARPDLPYLRRRVRAAAASPPVQPPPVAVPPAGASSSLDLSAPAPAPAPTVAPRSAAQAAVEPAVPAQLVGAGQRLVLSAGEPAVTLSRVQSAIGTLVVEAAVSNAVGDVRLGCAYELSSGLTSTVQLGTGNRFAPANSKRPVLIAGHERYDRISVDLRQCTELRRFAVYVFSEGRQQLTWGGTLIVSTFSGAKIEIPLETLPASEIAVVLTGYNVGGRFVLRAELESITGSIREASRAYGYDRIAWLDDRTPVE